MILIISKQEYEDTTCQVVSWLRFFNSDYVLLYGEDVGRGLNLTICADKQGENLICFELYGKSFTLDDIKVVWYRKDALYVTPLVEKISVDENKSTLKNYITKEINTIKSYFYKLLQQKSCLTTPGLGNANKLEVLNEAQNVGINIPNTLVTTSKKELLRFVEKNKEVIVKPLGNPAFFYKKEESYGMYTSLLTEDMIKELPDIFFPCKLQKYIAKRYEIRTFYLDGQFYSMAIFSQNDSLTQVDFRQYNFKYPNRNSVYKLPKEVENKLGQLMQNLNLTTGSIDLIKTTDGEFVFLEINPVGQFGMVSFPCNYQLEKKVAQYLIQKNNAA